MPIHQQKIQIQEGEESRIDVFLSLKFPDISRAYLQKVISTAEVLVNGKSVKKGHVLQAGDLVEILGFQKPEERSILPNSKEKLRILFQEEDVLVIDKPGTLPTHPNDFEDDRTIANLAIAQFPEMVDVGDEKLRPGIVHRLDTHTSGVLLLARSENVFRSLRKQFDERLIKKTYTALVFGKTEKEGEIDTSLAHHPTNPRKMVAVKEGTRYRSTVREAKTRYDLQEEFSEYSLLAVKTLTGRMHQVRVHLASIGHPLVGDRLYQSSRFRKADCSGLSRHFLHASKITFTLPETKREISVESDLPSELLKVIEKLRSSGS